MNIQHCGLYFTPEHIQQARHQREQEPYPAAWKLLGAYLPANPLVLAQLQGLRYRFSDDAQSGEQAVEILQNDPFTVESNQSYLETVAALVTQAQIFEMVRDHPAWANQALWLEAFAGRIQAVEKPLAELAYVDQLWLNLLQMVSSIVLEQEERFQQAVEVFKRVIEHDIHPEGYILKVVDLNEDQKNYYGDGLYRMLLSAKALILTAEAASHAGVDLWAYENRGVSAMTPTPYLLYYYYFPEKWRWDDGLTLEATQTLYREHAGMWDIAQRRVFSRDRKVLLDELRPIYDMWSGGLTTLTHGSVAEQRKRRGWFG